MADDVDATLREAEATIAKADAVLKQASEAMAAGKKVLADNNTSAEALHAFIAAQNSEGQEEFRQEVQAVQDEIARDLPKQQAVRQTRVRPGRQMVEPARAGAGCGHVGQVAPAAI